MQLLHTQKQKTLDTWKIIYKYCPMPFVDLGHLHTNIIWSNKILNMNRKFFSMMDNLKKTLSLEIIVT